MLSYQKPRFKSCPFLCFGLIAHNSSVCALSEDTVMKKGERRDNMLSVNASYGPPAPELSHLYCFPSVSLGSFLEAADSCFQSKSSVRFHVKLPASHLKHAEKLHE